MNKLIIIFLIFIGLSVEGLAQQEVQFTQFMNNKLYYNPSFAGARETASFKAMYRSQWVGFEGAPKSRLLSFDTPLFGDRVGFGLTFLSYEQGIINNWQASMAYAYKIKLTDQLKLRVGLQGSMRYYGINFNDPDFMVLERNDPSIMDDVKTNNYYGNFGVGVCLVHDKYYVGISIPNLYNNDIGFSPEDYDDFAKESRHYYAMAGTRFALSEQLQLRPSVLLKYVENAPFDVEANVSLTIDNSVTAGLSYRAGGDGLGESIDLLAMYQLNKIALGLSYDVGISKISRSSSGSFEVLLRYDLIGIRSDIVNPRFFY